MIWAPFDKHALVRKKRIYETFYNIEYVIQDYDNSIEDVFRNIPIQNIHMWQY